MNITPNKLSIAQLFATPNEQFIVPSYQRRYAWGFNQYCALYEDIDMLKENDGHLFGMIILHTSFHTAGINQPELVDGQQRMTTLVLFLKAFEHVFRQKDKEDKANEIRKMIICKGLDDVERPKIKLGDLDNKDVENLVLKNQFQDLENKNIRFAINDYIKWLSELELDELNKLFFKLTNIAVIIRLDVGMAQDAYKLFETINNRGLKLKPTDIIKNFLLGHAAKINQNNVLEEVKNLWSKVIVNLDDLDSDDFLRQFMSSILQRKITMTLLVIEFKKYYLKNVEFAELLGEFEYYQEDEYFEEEDENEVINEDEIEIKNENQFTIIEFLEKLVKLSEVYRKISMAKHESVKINRRLRNLNQILSKSTYIFLMHFLLETKYIEREKLNVLKYLEALMLRRHICERRTNENDDIFSKIVGFIGNDNILEKIKRYIDDEGYIPDDNDFEVYFPKHQFKGKLIDRAKYVLENIEYYKRGNTDELVIASNQEVHLEHIIPQTISTKKSKQEYGNWEDYLGEKSISKHKKYVNFIGNMTLLGESLNIQAYNNPFTKKKGSYKVSNLLIANELSNYSDFKFNQVDKRSDAFTEIALKIWKI